MSERKTIEGLLREVVERVNTLTKRVDHLETALRDCSERVHRLEETVEELPAEAI